MSEHIAIVGAGVSGLTCGVMLAEHGYQTAIFADESAQRTTSGAAAAMWYPYDAGPADKVIPWALQTYQALTTLAGDPLTGVSVIELRTFTRLGEIRIPDWAIPLGARRLLTSTAAGMTSGFALEVPLMDTTIYLDYLNRRFMTAGGTIQSEIHFEKL